MCLENVHEVFDLNDTSGLLLVRLSFLNHLLKLSACHVLTEFIGDALQVLECDVVLLLREEDEGFLELFFSIALRHFCRHDVHEVVEVNRYHTFLVFIVVSVLSVVAEL